MVVIAVVAVVVLAGGSSDTASAGVQRELVTSSGTDPFMPSVAAAPPSPTAPTTTLPPTNGTVQSFTGSTPGLYGGTQNNQVCDAQQLVNFLAANPDKGAAWAGVLGIRTSDIPTYVATLTPLLLRADTRVDEPRLLERARDGAAVGVAGRYCSSRRPVRCAARALLLR